VRVQRRGVLAARVRHRDDLLRTAVGRQGERCCWRPRAASHAAPGASARRAGHETLARSAAAPRSRARCPLASMGMASLASHMHAQRIPAGHFARLAPARAAASRAAGIGPGAPNVGRKGLSESFAPPVAPHAQCAQCWLTVAGDVSQLVHQAGIAGRSRLPADVAHARVLR